MAFFAAFGLVLVLIIRPQEIWTVLNIFRLLDVLTGLAVVGVIADFATGKQKNGYSPQLPFLGAFVGICYVSTIINIGRPGLEVAFKSALIPALGMLAVMYGVRSFARLRALIMLLIACGALVSVVAIQQGQQEPTCIELAKDPDTNVRATIEEGVPDGRSCDSGFSCEKEGKPLMDYGCERLGWFKTVSTGRRVRWRGQLGDPNELSVYLGAVIPLVFAMVSYVRKSLFTLIALGVIGASLYAVILTQSRGGQLVIGTVFGIYFVSRFGAKGVIGAAALALPVVMLGGREGLDAEDSSTERLQLLYEGVTLVTQKPIIGVGAWQFPEHMWNGLSAHNSYLLSLAELGFPGFFCWSGLVWTSLKIPLTIVRNPPPLLDPRVKPFAMSILVSFLGACVGIFFLSFTYKQLLFVWFGMAGGLYGMVKAADASFEVPIGKKDFIGLIVFDIALFVILFFYTRLKGTGGG